MPGKGRASSLIFQVSPKNWLAPAAIMGNWPSSVVNVADTCHSSGDPCKPRMHTEKLTSPSGEQLAERANSPSIDSQHSLSSHGRSYAANRANRLASAGVSEYAQTTCVAWTENPLSSAVKDSPCRARNTNSRFDELDFIENRICSLKLGIGSRLALARLVEV